MCVWGVGWGTKVLRNTTLQDRLIGLCIMSIESLSQEVDFEKVINNFAAKKARKVVL